jgi:Tol biopolymer transport system component
MTDQGAVNQVALVRPDGSERKVLVTSQPDQECLNPLWSPDGQGLQKRY